MTGFGLRKNMVFEWSGIAYRIERLQPNGEILLERLDDGQLSIVVRDTLLKEYSAGSIAAAQSGQQLGENQPQVYSRPLSELSEPMRNEAERRRHYLQAVIEQGLPVSSTRDLAPLIQTIADQIGDTAPPSRVTLWRWYRRYRVSQDTRALIPRTDRRGKRQLRQCARVLQFASEAVEEAFKASPRATAPVIHSRLQAKIEAENRRLLPHEQIKVPTLRTLYRMMDSMEAYQQVVLREGKSIADKRFRLAKSGTRTSHILERVEIDHTPLDLFLIDEKTCLPMGRPTLTVVIDHFSRMLLGYYLSFGAPSTAAVIGALRQAILHKQPANKVLPELHIKHPWPCYGRPDVMVVDNGMEFHSSDLESVAYDLGIRLQFCPKHEPRFKGAVERYLKTINYFFAHQLPGTSLARLHERGDYDSQKHALLTLAEFNQIFQKWVLDVYAQTVHRGMHETPWARWHEGLQRREPELPESIHALQRCIGQVEERALRHDGILLNGIRYNGDVLAPILNAYGIGTKVRVLYDPEDLGSIHVWGPDDAEPVHVLALNQEHARGLTLRQNELIRTSLREKGESGQDRPALERARQDIIKTVDTLMASRKQRDRRRAAAIRGLSSSKPEESLSDGSQKELVPSFKKPAKPILDIPSSELPKQKLNAPPTTSYPFIRPTPKVRGGGV